MRQHIADILGVQHEVDRHQHGIRARDGKSQGNERMAVARDQRDPVAGADAGFDQTIGKPIDEAIEFGIAPLRIAAEDSGPIAVAQRGAAQHAR